MVYRAFALYSIVFLFCGPAFCEPAVDLVIADGEFGQYLSNDSAISKVPDGRVINVAFRYADYDFRHPYLIASAALVALSAGVLHSTPPWGRSSWFA